jgi:hypothetical protein
MVNDNIMKSMSRIKAKIDAEHAAQRAAVKAMNYVVEVAVRTDLIDQFLDQAHEVPGRYSVAPGRVWRSGDHRFRNYLVGWFDFSGPLDIIATQVRWDCTPDGRIGCGFEV